MIKFVSISDLCDLADPDQQKAVKGAIKTAIEYKEQHGVEVLKLASGFVTWKTEKINNANAPLFLYSLEIENEGGAGITFVTGGDDHAVQGVSRWTRRQSK